MKKLILDYSIWRCGMEGDYQVGVGDTALLNSEGYMCCLGQFSLQLNSNLIKENLMDRGMPDELHKEITDLSNFDIGIRRFNTPLANAAAKINDDEDTSPEMKITLLKELFKKYNYEIEVINKP